ncbi:MAG: DNA starvation/stationary phase protection protein [Hyphomicrobiales bacterium]|nr:DNA starvation/stationary phase protection protein [Hyphomicrobiales bacterium]MCY4033134.1 DNA starvation/stationary phase protection protein [Hyphomicrobiales bacterium]MCY4039399.1 DNA starvation/stationary phase protection protein [Hyphomicrobiales bacterium]
MKINIGIPEKDRVKVAKGLSNVLADTYTLYLKTHGYHWNVTGPMFTTLHQMFEEQYNELWLATDQIAERIRALGVKAPSGYQAFTRLSAVKDDGDSPDATAMISALVSGHETLVRTARKIMPVAEKAGDDVSVDLLTQRMESSEKTAWMLRSLLE